MPLNSKLSRIIGQEVDILVTQLKMRKKVAELISQNAVESSWPSGAEWPLIAWKNNFKIEARFFEGLSWENPDRLSLSKKEIEKKYDSPEEWEKRFKNAKEINQFISRF